MGDDPFGLAESLKSLGRSSKFIEPVCESLARFLLEKTRPTAESVLHDIGNYTKDYRDTFQRLVGDDPQVELLDPTWSGQNHHLARADLAVKLLHQLLERPLPPDHRVLFWGHSHAGNAFALLTNLLANEPAAVNSFFEAAGDQSGEHWKVVRLALRNAPSPHPLADRVVIATFGTPVRYGWDTSGCSQLVHLTFHRPHDPEHPLTTMPLYPPQKIKDIMGATWGDWVQAFAIAGTDVTTPASSEANQKLGALLESNLPEPEFSTDTMIILSKQIRAICARWKLGTRCHADGLNLLVDYVPSGEKTLVGQAIETTVFGHGVATTIKWLPTHLQLIVEALS